MDNHEENLSLSEQLRRFEQIEERLDKVERSNEKMKEESFNELIKSMKLAETLEGLSKATVELRAENKELREEIKNMNNILRTTLTDTLNKMVEMSKQQNTATLMHSSKENEFLRKLVYACVGALVTIVLSVLGIKALMPM